MTMSDDHPTEYVDLTKPNADAASSTPEPSAPEPPASTQAAPAPTEEADVLAGSPPAAVMRLHAAAVFALAQPDVQARMNQIGIVPLGSSPDDFAAFVVAQRERAARLIRLANITLG